MQGSDDGTAEFYLAHRHALVDFTSLILGAPRTFRLALTAAATTRAR